MESISALTRTERILQRLCANSFLRLWTYGNVYKDQAISGDNRQGKEICDALVVFQNNVIIFSDKECAFPTHNDLNVSWIRWHKRAIEKSRDQLRGAERWLREFSDRVFIDSACTEKLLALPSDWNEAKIYKVIVANGVSKDIQARFRDSGSLMLMHSGSVHHNDEPPEALPEPFTIKTSSSDDKLFHVFDEFNLSIILKQLDTISDFVRYLDQRETLFRSGISFFAPGEEELLAYYLQHTDESGQHDFVFDDVVDAVGFESGLWEEFEKGDHRKSAVLANRQSYLWDGMIETITDSLLKGNLRYPVSEGRTREMKILEQLASENRFARRILARSLLEVIFRPDIDMGMYARTVRPESMNDPFYVFFSLSRPREIESEVYRETRVELLTQYCRAVRNHFEQAKDIYGVATEMNSQGLRSWDVIYFDGSAFSEQDARESRAFSNEFGLYRNLHTYHSHSFEYPIEGAESRILINSRRGKGRDRNRPCSCGSGRKYKNCCGRVATSSKLEWINLAKS